MFNVAVIFDEVRVSGPTKNFLVTQGANSWTARLLSS